MNSLLTISQIVNQLTLLQLFSYESETIPILPSESNHSFMKPLADFNGLANRNYLQSPYYFMCTTLVSANDSSPPLPQQALAGTLVSSLHRLKDIDNTGTQYLQFHTQPCGFFLAWFTDYLQMVDFLFLETCRSRLKESTA